MTQRYDELKNSVIEDIQNLPLGAIQLAGALVAVHPKLPQKFASWVLHEMGKRVNMQEVSPVAEAAMRIYIFSEAFDKEFGFTEVSSQYAIIKAMRKEEELHIAVAFFQKLFERIEDALTTGFEVREDVNTILNRFRLNKELIAGGGMMSDKYKHVPDIQTFQVSCLIP